MRYSYNWRNIFCPGDADNFFQDHPSASFQADTSSFSETNGWWLSELSRIIYFRGNGKTSETDARNRLLKEHGLEEQWYYDGKLLQCALVASRDPKPTPFKVLVFRGTPSTVVNWLYNFKTAASHWPTGGKVHRGFKALVLENFAEIENQLKKVDGPLYFTGHSLGGALAVLTATLFPPRAVYTFGTPRIGNKEFLESLQEIKIYRVVNRGDIVTTMPPLPTMLHAGRPYTMNNAEVISAHRPWFCAPEFLAAHSPVNYTAQLESRSFSH